MTDSLTARVVTPGYRPRIHGYDVEADLARHYRFTDLVLLAITGELPPEPAGLAFDVALQFLAPVHVGEAPVHAAVLSRLCGAGAAGVLGTASIGLAQQARHLLAGSAGLLEWLGGRTEELPAACRPAGDAEVEAVDRLRAALAPTGLSVRGLDAGLALQPALLAVLYACGLTSPEAMELAIVLARLPCATAEALGCAPGRFEEYPMNLPPFSCEQAP